MSATASKASRPQARRGAIDGSRHAGARLARTVQGDCGQGHASCINYVRSGFLLLAEFRPDAYHAMMAADLQEGASTTKADVFSRFLWVKNARSNSK